MAKVIELPAPKDTSYITKASALYEAGRIDEAYAEIDAYMMREPNDAQALALMSAILKKANKCSIAYSIAKRATEIRPDRPEPWNAFAHAAQFLWRMEESESAYRKALERTRDPKQKALYLNNLASTFIDRGRFAKAEPLCRESLALNDDKQTRHNLGLSLMAQHKWEEGWQLYSASLGTANRLSIRYRSPGNEEPVWDGSPGKTVVVYGEQGLGDEICAASMLPDAVRDSKKVIVDCDKRLQGLFRRSFPQANVYGTRTAKPGEGRWEEKPEDIEASIAGFELGQFYRKSDADFPGTPYLIPDPDRVAMWKGLFATKGKPVIGIAWSGGTWHNAGEHRKLPLDQWKPIFDAIDAHWVSLQYKDASEQIKGTQVMQYPYGTLTSDYDDTAALVASCDLVIAVQTSVNHLAGALGVPVWAMIPEVSQWRYGESGSSIPWYRSMRLFRQQQGKWPVNDIAAELKRHFHQS
jgi:tetratricopeptide (TPR) repeat protein